MLEDFEHPLRTGSGSLSAYGSISSTRTADITHVGASNRGAIDHPHHHKHHFLVKLLLVFSPVRNIVRGSSLLDNLSPHSHFHR
jgi:hypothetical protein